MDGKIDPAEIRNPKLTLARRERDAGLREATPKQEPKGGMPQTQFTRAKPPTPAEKAKQDAQFQAHMAEKAKRKAEREAKGYAKGGVTRGDGCVTKGRTKGRFV